MTRFRMLNWWISQKLDNLHIILALIGVLICLTGIISGETEFCRYGSAGLTVLGVVYFLHEHLYRFRQYLKDYGSQDRLPLQRMKQMNGVLLLLYLAAFFILAEAGLKLPWKTLGNFMKTVFISVVRWLFSLLPAGEGESFGEAPQTDGGFFLPELMPGKTSPFMEFLDHALYGLLILLAAAGMVWGVVQAGKKLAAYLGSLSFDEDEVTFLKPDSIRERAKKEEKHHIFKWRVPFFNRHSQGRIRYLYWSCIQKGIKKQNAQHLWQGMPYMTPEQLEKAAGIREQAIHTLYEKARYSQKGCDALDENLMKACCRQTGEKSAAQDSD